MTAIEIGPASEGRLGELATLAARAQTDDERFVAYLADDAVAIAAEIAAVERWPAATSIASRSGRVVGWLLAETDRELGRVWWWGPVVAAGERWDEVADALYAVGRAALDREFDEEELAVATSSGAFDRFADRHGFRANPSSADLRVEIGPVVADRRVRALAPADADEVARLHDELFPGTHATGHQVVTATGGVRLVIRDGAQLAGYLVAALDTAGAGYIDFVGVDPRRRRRGFGRALVVAALAELRELGATRASLTMREGNPAAIELYRTLGFEQTRLIRPYRKGFSLER